MTRTFFTATGALDVLSQVSLVIRQRESCALVGASGSGKSTLLSIIGLLDRPTVGKVLIYGGDTSKACADSLAAMRNHLIGFVFQSFNLLPKLDATANVALPLIYRGVRHDHAKALALKQLELVGLGGKAHSFPADMSGGERQRVAFARAVVGSPPLILADEPTGNLDPDSAQRIIDLLLALNGELGSALVIVTHDQRIANQMDRRLYLANGRFLDH